MRISNMLLLFLFSCIGSIYAEKSGKEAYKLSCVQCHGENGAGGKDFLQGPNLTILKDKYFMEQFKAILDGKRKGPGTVNMLKILKESKLSDKEIQAAAKYAMKLPRAGANHKKFGDAKKGKVHYSTKCIHCHGMRGEGYSNPALPAPRLLGQSDFYIVDQIKSFKAGHRDTGTPANLQMKAMSNLLVTEDDMKDVAAYLRTLDDFKPSAISGLSFKVYQGKWSKIPDFTKLKHVKDGSLPNGLMDIKASEMKDGFAMVFEGKLNVPKDGQYTFNLSSDDGSKLYVGGKLLISNDGVHPASKAINKKIKLKAGSVDIKVEYFEGGGQEELNLAWTGPGFKLQALSTTGGKKTKKGGGGPPIPLEPNKVAGEAKLFRNFIKGASSRSIAVGYPEGTHIVFDATNLNLALMWKGKYLDAFAMWHGRGTGHMEPQGDAVEIGKLPQVGVLANTESQFPDLSRSSNQVRKSDLRFRGYSLDQKRYPTFMYSLKEVRFEDFFKPIDTNGTGIVRTVTARSSNTSNLWFRVAVDNITEVGGVFNVGGNYKVVAEGAKIRQYGKIQELIIPFNFTDGSATVKVQYLFAGE